MPLRADVIVFLLPLLSDREHIVPFRLVIGIALVAQERGRDNPGRGGRHKGLGELLWIAAQRFSKRSQLHLDVSQIRLIVHGALALVTIEQLSGQFTGACQTLAKDFAVFGKLDDVRHAFAWRHAAPSAGKAKADISLESDTGRLAIAADVDAALKLLRHKPIGRTLDLAAHLGLVDRQGVVALDKEFG